MGGTIFIALLVTLSSRPVAITDQTWMHYPQLPAKLTASGVTVVKTSTAALTVAAAPSERGIDVVVAEGGAVRNGHVSSIEALVELITTWAEPPHAAPALGRRRSRSAPPPAGPAAENRPSVAAPVANAEPGSRWRVPILVEVGLTNSAGLQGGLRGLLLYSMDRLEAGFVARVAGGRHMIDGEGNRIEVAAGAEGRLSFFRGEQLRAFTGFAAGVRWVRRDGMFVSGVPMTASYDGVGQGFDPWIEGSFGLSSSGDVGLEGMVGFTFVPTVLDAVDLTWYTIRLGVGVRL